MRPAPYASLNDKLAEGGVPEAGYDEWLRAKIERAVDQARDPAALIPAEQVWRDLGLET